ncbi:LuxR C-terminal-related transcriptional regulator [Streptomyces sp. DW26H14]|uniref:LuxR C-terminal-related transcriptional regulator n=1 Tax=Streptomyces sp. DW26H14 TaxID=3435395 RepID=UPI00403DE5ED
MSSLLTQRQRELLLLVANGNTRRQIAIWLGLEISGVDTRLRRIYRELGVSSQPQAVAVALKTGELRLEDVREPVGHEGAA